MAELCDLEKEQIATELMGLIFLNPENREWEAADHYLTGDVKNKLVQAQKYAQNNSSFKVNIEALEAVQPLELEAADILVQLGSTWVPNNIMYDFCTHLLGENALEGVTYHQALGQWQ